MSSSSEKTALPLALLLCAATPTQVDGTQSFALTPPAAGDYVLTLERDADAPKARSTL